MVKRDSKLPSRLLQIAINIYGLNQKYFYHQLKKKSGKNTGSSNHLYYLTHDRTIILFSFNLSWNIRIYYHKLF